MSGLRSEGPLETTLGCETGDRTEKCQNGGGATHKAEGYRERMEQLWGIGLEEEFFLNMYFSYFNFEFLKSKHYFLVLSRDHQGMLESSNKMCKAKDRVLGREP